MPAVVVIGLGPAGLGAAVRLEELKCPSWQVIEASNSTGGLSRSVVDTKGHAWDIGGHVLFSHYEYFDRIVESSDVQLNSIDRRCKVIYQQGRLVGDYPIQSNIDQLPEEIRQKCKLPESPCTQKAENMWDFGVQTFGRGLHEFFFEPYNRKVWAHDLRWMSTSWIGERVAVPGKAAVPERVALPQPAESAESKQWDDTSAGTSENDPDSDKENTSDDADKQVKPDAEKKNRRDSTSSDFDKENRVDDADKQAKTSKWGPNSCFRYPRAGGIGALYEAIRQQHVPDGKIVMGTTVQKISCRMKQVQLEDGSRIGFDKLITTMPLTELLNSLIDIDLKDLAYLRAILLPVLKHSSTKVVGITYSIPAGDSFKPPEWHWAYFPEDDCPFYRCMCLSNMTTPGEASTVQLQFEISESDDQKSDSTFLQSPVGGSLINLVLASAKSYGLMPENAIDVSTWYCRVEYGYPIPTVGLNEAVTEAAKFLASKYDIYTRGRFGAWLYQYGNMDHSFMQGVDAVNRIIQGPSAPQTVGPNWNP